MKVNALSEAGNILKSLLAFPGVIQAPVLLLFYLLPFDNTLKRLLFEIGSTELAIHYFYVLSTRLLRKKTSISCDKLPRVKIQPKARSKLRPS